MTIRRFLSALSLAALISGLAACSAGPNSSGFMPATTQPAATNRTAKDVIEPHP
jgi:uncharacterized lipoprotein YajG